MGLKCGSVMKMFTSQLYISNTIAVDCEVMRCVWLSVLYVTVGSHVSVFMENIWPY